MKLELNKIEGIDPNQRTKLCGIHETPCTINYYAGIYGDKKNITIVILEREDKPKPNYYDIKINEPEPQADDLRQEYITRVWSVLTVKIDDHKSNFPAIRKAINDFLKDWNIAGIKINEDFEPVNHFIKRRFKPNKIDTDAGYFTLNCLINEDSIYFDKSLIEDFQNDLFLRSKKEDEKTKRQPTDRIKALYVALTNFDYTQSPGISASGLAQKKPIGIAC